MEKLIGNLINEVRTLQLSVAANILLSILALGVALWVQRAQERFKLRLKHRLTARNELLAIEQNLFHELEKLSQKRGDIEHRNELTLSLRDKMRNAKSWFPKGVFEGANKVVCRLTENAQRLDSGDLLPDSYFKERAQFHNSLDELEKIIWG